MFGRRQDGSNGDKGGDGNGDTPTTKSDSEERKNADAEASNESETRAPAAEPAASFATGIRQDTPSRQPRSAQRQPPGEPAAAAIAQTRPAAQPLAVPPRPVGAERSAAYITAPPEAAPAAARPPGAERAPEPEGAGVQAMTKRQHEPVKIPGPPRHLVSAVCLDLTTGSRDRRYSRPRH